MQPLAVRRMSAALGAIALCAPCLAPAAIVYTGDGSAGGLVPDFPQV